MKRQDDDNDPASMPDEENPELTEAYFRNARPALEVLAEAFGPKIVEEIRGRGRPKKADRKVNQTLRLDPDVLQSFRDTGSGWQSLINQVLRDHMPSQRK